MAAIGSNADMSSWTPLSYPLRVDSPYGTITISAPAAPNPDENKDFLGDADRDKDIKKLIEILNDIRTSLDFFMENYDVLAPRSKEFQGKFQLSWNEVKDTFTNVNRLLNSNLSKSDKNEFDFNPNIRVGLNFALLKTHGLTGNQLALKHSILNQLNQNWKKYLPDWEEVKKYFPDWKKVKKYLPDWEEVKKYLLKHLGKFFDYANRILQSLSAVLPPVGAIKEFKDAVEAAIDFSAVNPEDK